MRYAGTAPSWLGPGKRERGREKAGHAGSDPGGSKEKEGARVRFRRIESLRRRSGGSQRQKRAGKWTFFGGRCSTDELRSLLAPANSDGRGKRNSGIVGGMGGIIFLIMTPFSLMIITSLRKEPVNFRPSFQRGRFFYGKTQGKCVRGCVPIRGHNYLRRAQTTCLRNKIFWGKCKK